MPKFSSSRNTWHSLVQVNAAQKGTSLLDARLDVDKRYLKNQNLRANRSCSQHVYIPLIGFCTAILAYPMLKIQRQLDGQVAGAVSFILGLAMAIFMYMSDIYQSLILLAIPSLSSSKGRGVLVTMAVAVAMTGPFQNAIRNYEGLTSSLQCTQVVQKQMTSHSRQQFTNNMNSMKTNMVTTLNETVQNDFQGMIHVYDDMQQNIQSFQGLIGNFINFFVLDYLAEAAVPICYVFLRFLIENPQQSL